MYKNNPNNWPLQVVEPEGCPLTSDWSPQNFICYTDSSMLIEI